VASSFFVPIRDRFAIRGTAAYFVTLAFPALFAIQLINCNEEEGRKLMTQESNSSPGKVADATAGPFPPAEVETLHSLDREAARNIVCLLGGLFIVGLILYICVAIWVY
jgi:hypothetical protein